MRVALHIQHPFIAQHVRSVNLHDSGQELLELRAIERLVRAEREGADVLVVLMLAVLEERRIELEGRVEAETADSENVLDIRGFNLNATLELEDRKSKSLKYSY